MHFCEHSGSEICDCLAKNPKTFGPGKKIYFTFPEKSPRKKCKKKGTNFTVWKKSTKMCLRSAPPPPPPLPTINPPFHSSKLFKEKPYRRLSKKKKDAPWKKKEEGAGDTSPTHHPFGFGVPVVLALVAWPGFVLLGWACWLGGPGVSGQGCRGPRVCQGGGVSHCVVHDKNLFKKE